MRPVRSTFLPLLVAFALAACAGTGAGDRGDASAPVADPGAGPRERATFAGGCFWCMEHAFEGIEGVASVTSGYAGGGDENPTYQEVSKGATGHVECIQVLYDPSKTSYRELLAIYWRNVDPTTPDRQFCDQGSQYRPAIFWHDETQREMAEASRREIEASGRFERVVVEIVSLDRFWPAEEYHQDFWKKNPVRYKAYRLGCGRDRRLEQLWGERPPSHPD